MKVRPPLVPPAELETEVEEEEEAPAPDPDPLPSVLATTDEVALARKVATIKPEAVMGLWLRGRTATTLRAYQGDLEAFAIWMGEHLGGGTLTPKTVITWLLEQESRAAHALLFEWRAAMAEAGLAPNTINRRLAAMRSLTKLARLLGATTWEIEVPNAKGGNVRETRGPDGSQVELLLQATTKSRTPTRDRALLGLLIALGLRREEAATLHVDDYDRSQRSLLVRGKGGTMNRMAVPPEAATALEAWLEERPEDGTPRLFQLSTAGVYYRISKLGRLCGVKLHPHGLRHSAVTAGLDATGGDIRKVKAFSRHAKVETVLAYDDVRKDHAGEVSRAVAERLLKNLNTNTNIP